MENNFNENIASLNKQDLMSDATIIKTDSEKNGQNKCPKCGSTDISLNINNGSLRCNFCRHEFQDEKIEELENDINQLKGQVIASGAKDIVADSNEMITIKCSSCGAEVVTDTASATQARCHWCRNTLSINEKVPNGAVPDTVLPFLLKKEEAKKEIEKFVKKRKFFAHPKFRMEFTTENIMGVYFPYMIVDINAHGNLKGQAEKLIREYTENEGDNRVTYYDADLYQVQRDFDIIIDGLTVESSLDKLNTSSNTKATNIINSIMPFDIENVVRWNANYLKGFTSEKRDVNIEQLRPLVETQTKDIVKFAANDTLKQYNRGVAWQEEQVFVKGQQWQSAYLPVWLYSYHQVKGNKQFLHYVAVNARTKETMGSVPIHIPKLILASAFVDLLSLIVMSFIDWDYDFIFLISGFIYFFIIHEKYRNKNARHKYELETKKEERSPRRSRGTGGSCCPPMGDLC